MVVVRVIDNGDGIDPDLLLRVFDVFTLTTPVDLAIIAKILNGLGEARQIPCLRNPFGLHRCLDRHGNEWHLRVTWAPPLKTPISNADVRSKTGVGLPVRSSFCRLWDSKVQSFLEQRAKA